MSKYNYQYDFKCCDCGTDYEVSSYTDHKNDEFHLCDTCAEIRNDTCYKFSELSDKAKGFAVFNYVMGETEPSLFADAWQFHIDNENEWLFDEDGEYIEQ